MDYILFCSPQVGGDMAERNKIKINKTNVESLKAEAKVFDIFDSEQNRFGVRVHPTGRKTYFYTYRNKDKKRQRITLGVHGDITADIARNEAVKYAGQIAASIDPKEQSKAEKYKTLGGFIKEKYEPWRKAEKKTAAAEIEMLRRNFEVWYELELMQIDTKLVGEWRTQKLNEGIHNKSVNRYIAGLKSALSFAVKTELIPLNPLQKLKPLKIDDREKVRFLSDDEEKRFRKAIDQREARLCKERESANIWRKQRNYDLFPEIKEGDFADHIKPIILLLMNTGCRPIEVLTLEWQSVDLKRKQITIEGKHAKSGKTRHIPLSREALETLEQWKKQGSGSLVFPSPVSKKAMDKLPRTITKLIQDAYLENFRPYDLRHSYASKLAMAGIDLNTIRELLGHAEISTTLIYAHLSEDHKRQAIELVFNKA